MAASTRPAVNRFAAWPTTLSTRCSSNALTRSSNSPWESASRMRLARRGSRLMNSLPSNESTNSEPAEGFHPASTMVGMLSWMASTGEKAGSRCWVAWSRLSSAFATSVISAGGRRPWAPASRANSMSTEPAWISGPSDSVEDTRCATSSRNAPGSKSSRGCPMPARVEAVASPSPSPMLTRSFTSEARTGLGIRATIPRSMSPSFPSGVSRRLPGWGSACSTPSTSIARSMNRNSVAARLGPSTSSRPNGVTSVTFLPGTNCRVKTASVE